MTTILVWLGRQAGWVIALCLLGAFGYTVVGLTSRRKRNTAQFALEREVHQEHMARAFVVGGLFLALAGVLYVVSRAVVPILPSPAVTPTVPSVGLFTATPQPTVSGGPTATATPLGAGEVVTTPVVTEPVAVPLEPEMTPTITPTPTQVPVSEMQPDCPESEAQLTLPVAGSTVSGIVEIQGTANVNAFSYYKFEVRFPGADSPNFVSQYDTAVENGSLGTWDVGDAQRYPPGGPYLFQLVVVDIYGNTKTCTIPVNIVAVGE